MLGYVAIKGYNALLNYRIDHSPDQDAAIAASDANNSI
jgi:hypothetical protein